MENTYLFEADQMVKSFESVLNFEAIVGGPLTADAAMEGFSPKDSITKMAAAVKAFFEKIWEAIIKFFKDHFVGETMIEFSAVTEIKATIRDFMKVYNEELQSTFTAMNADEKVVAGNAKLEAVIKDHAAEAEKVIENIQKLKEESKLGKSGSSKINATPVKECRAIIETTHKTLTSSTEKLYQLASRHLNDPVTGEQAQAIYERYSRVTMTSVNQLYNLLFKIMNAGKVHYSANAKNE